MGGNEFVELLAELVILEPEPWKSWGLSIGAFDEGLDVKICHKTLIFICLWLSAITFAASKSNTVPVIFFCHFVC